MKYPLSVARRLVWGACFFRRALGGQHLNTRATAAARSSEQGSRPGMCGYWRSDACWQPAARAIATPWQHEGDTPTSAARRQAQVTSGSSTVKACGLHASISNKALIRRALSIRPSCWRRIGPNRPVHQPTYRLEVSRRRRFWVLEGSRACSQTPLPEQRPCPALPARSSAGCSLVGGAHPPLRALPFGLNDSATPSRAASRPAPASLKLPGTRSKEPECDDRCQQLGRWCSSRPGRRRVQRGTRKKSCGSSRPGIGELFAQPPAFERRGRPLQQRLRASRPRKAGSAAERPQFKVVH